jgi:S1-C subfamily serine protease
VAEVVDGGSAAGVLKENDVITGIDGKKIHKFSELQEALAQHRPGDKIKVTIVRNKSEKTVDLTLKNSQGNTKVVKNAGMDVLGGAFQPISDNTKEQLGLSYGLEVTGVSDGKLKDAGVRRGFIILKVNGENMRTTDDLEQALRTATQSPEQVLFITGIFPSGRRANYAVSLSDE